jgi:hypothetical protein
MHIQNNQLPTTQYKVILLVLSCLWMLLHPFTWLNHDGLLYAFQAESFLAPSLAHTDLFSRYLNQGSLSIFTPLYGYLTQQLGLFNAAFTLYIGSQLLWFIAISYFSLSLLKNKQQGLLAILVICCFAGYYSLGNIFRTSEFFLTARLPAEALTILGLAFSLNSRKVTCSITLLLALVIHPLVGIWGGVLIACYYIGKRFNEKTLLYIATIVVFIFCFIIYLLPNINPLWWNIVQSRNVHLFYFNSGFSFGLKLTHQVLLLIFAYYYLPKHWQQLSFIVLVLLFSVMSVNLIAEYNQQLPIIALQMPRFIFLSQLWALLITIKLVTDKKILSGDWSLKLLLITSWGVATTSGACLVLLVFVINQLNKIYPLSRTHWFYFRLLTIIVMGFLATLILLNIFLYPISIEVLSILPDLIFALLPLVLIFALLWYYASIHSFKFTCLSALFIVPLCLSGFMFLSASDVSFSQKDKNTINQLQAIIKTNETVFWPENIITVWITLKRSYYVSTRQMAPAVFSEHLSLEAIKRFKNLVNTNTFNPLMKYNLPSWFSEITKNDKSAPNWQLLCQDTFLDWLIVGKPITDIKSEELIFSLNNQKYYLYSCDNIAMNKNRTTNENLF